MGDDTMKGRGIRTGILVLLAILLMVGGADATSENIVNAAYVDAYYSNTNYGTEDVLLVHSPPEFIENWAYIELPQNTIFPIYLNIYLRFTDYIPQNVGIYNTDIFNEDTITWNNKPSLGSQITSFTTNPKMWYNVTISSASNKYIILKATSSSIEPGFCSDDIGVYCNAIPYITYTAPPTFDPSGYVKDSNGKVLTGVNITYGNTTIWSNATGWYDFGNSFANGTYSYSVKHGFYVTQTGSITTSQGGSIVNYTLVHKCSGICDVYAAKNGSAANDCFSWTSACLNISGAVNLSQEYGNVHIGYGNYSNQTKINGTRSLKYFCDVAGYNESGFGTKCRFPPFGR